MADAYELALRALGQKERSEAELTEWLRARGVDQKEAAESISRLAEAGALDDARFARRYAEDKRELRGWGPDRIADALRARGVGDDAIAEAIEAEGDEAVIVRAAGVLAGAGAPVDDEPSRNRALGLLARRGYPLEAAYEAVRRHERDAAG